MNNPVLSTDILTMLYLMRVFKMLWQILWTLSSNPPILPLNRCWNYAGIRKSQTLKKTKTMISYTIELSCYCVVSPKSRFQLLLSIQQLFSVKI